MRVHVCRWRRQDFFSRECVLRGVHGGGYTILYGVAFNILEGSPIGLFMKHQFPNQLFLHDPISGKEGRMNKTIYLLLNFVNFSTLLNFVGWTGRGGGRSFSSSFWRRYLGVSIRHWCVYVCLCLTVVVFVCSICAEKELA